MRRAVVGSLLLVLSPTACQDDVLIVGDVPAAPQALSASYYAGAVTVVWELAAPGWNGEAFRVYSRRVTDSAYFLIAEVTSCSGGLCSYEDWNVVSLETYEYYVAAVDPGSGIETRTDVTVEVFVPSATPPPPPNAPFVVALDDANYLAWGTDSRGATDFSHYRVFQDADGSTFLLGETDSEGFLDQLAANGVTYSYFVTAVDTDGHESGGSVSASGTPRPDFHGEWVYAFSDQPALSGFRFEEDELTNPIRDGSAIDRHFRLETDVNGWWLVPGPQAAVFPIGTPTTALKCGVAADAVCTDFPVAPTTGYGSQDVELFTQTSYVLQVLGDDNLIHYGVIRIELLGFDQTDAIMIFDWAYQVQAGNPNLVPPGGG